MRKGFFSSAGTLAPSREPPSLIPHCGACKLKTQCLSPMMPVDGRGRRRILLVGEAPGQTEDDQGKPFVGKAGQFLEGVLDELEVDMREDCWIMNSLSCRPPDNKIGDLKRIDYCRPLVIQAIKRLKPQTIILLGAVAVKSLIGWVWKENADMGIMKWAGWSIPLQKTNAWVCPVWHPSFVMREGRGKGEEEVKRLIFKQHLKQAFSHTRRPWKEVPNWKSGIEILLDSEEAAEAIRQYQKEGAPIAWDIETTTLKPDGPAAEIYSCSISSGKRTISFPWFGKVPKAMKELLTSPIPKLGWHLKFEHRYIKATQGYTVKHWIYDGMVGTHVLDNRSAICSLKWQAFVRLGMEAYEESIKPYLSSNGSNTPNKIKQAPLNELLLYGGLDSLLEYKIDKIQMKELGIPI